MLTFKNEKLKKEEKNIIPINIKENGKKLWWNLKLLMKNYKREKYMKDQYFYLMRKNVIIFIYFIHISI